MNAYEQYRILSDGRGFIVEARCERRLFWRPWKKVERWEPFCEQRWVGTHTRNYVIFFETLAEAEAAIRKHFAPEVAPYVPVAAMKPSLVWIT